MSFVQGSQVTGTATGLGGGIQPGQALWKDMSLYSAGSASSSSSSSANPGALTAQNLDKLQQNSQPQLQQNRRGRRDRPFLSKAEQ